MQFPPGTEQFIAQCGQSDETTGPNRLIQGGLPDLTKLTKMFYNPSLGGRKGCLLRFRVKLCKKVTFQEHDWTYMVCNQLVVQPLNPAWIR